MKVSYKENKVGRSVKSLTFIVEDLDPRQYDYDELEKKLLDGTSNEIFCYINFS